MRGDEVDWDAKFADGGDFVLASDEMFGNTYTMQARVKQEAISRGLLVGTRFTHRGLEVRRKG